MDQATRVPPEVKERLLGAWRGEIEARAVYELIAKRMDPRRAEIVGRIADAELTHRRRLEERMTELGIPIPDPSSVRLSRWLRLQARIAPVERLLAAREAAEDDEVDDTYRRSTGDEDTDRLLRDIRHDERSHSMAVQEMRSGEAAATEDTISPIARERLEGILGRERWHKGGDSWISGAIYGANDGLAAVFGIVTGVSGATGGSSFVLTAGLAGAVASALSMATGAFLAERSKVEMAAANIEREREEIAAHPQEEKEELSLFYQLKGIDEETANRLAEQMAERPDAMLQALVAEEFGGGDGEDAPVQAAIAAGVSTGIGAIIPVLPFIFTTGTLGIALAAIVSLIAHFLVGAAKSLVTLRAWWSAGLEMTVAGVIVGGATYAVGLVIPT